MTPKASGTHGSGGHTQAAVGIHTLWIGKAGCPRTRHTTDPFLTPCTRVLSLAGVAVASGLGSSYLGNERKGSGGEDPSP